MKNLIVILWLVLCSIQAHSQAGVSIIDTSVFPTSPDASAILDLKSKNKGFLVPRLNTVERDNINAPASGLLLFNTDSGCFEFFNSSDWLSICNVSQGESDTLEDAGNDDYPRMIGYGGGLGSSSRNIMRNGFQDEDILVMYSGSYLVYIHSPLYGMQRRDVRNDYANALILLNAVVMNGNLYLLFYNNNTNEHVVYQYDVANINSGGTQVLISGQDLGQVADNIAMTSNGDNIYFSHNGANSMNNFEIARYSITGSTTFTYQNTIMCTSISGTSYGFMVDSDQVIYILGTDGYVYIYDSVGNFISTEGDYGISSSTAKSLNWNNHFYFGRSSIDKIMNRVYIKY